MSVPNPVAEPSASPTAQTVSAAGAATPAKPLSACEGLGVEDTVQEVPSQCSASVTLAKGPLVAYPTAHRSVGDRAATPLSWFRSDPGLGLGTTAHDVPSQCSMRV